MNCDCSMNRSAAGFEEYKFLMPQHLFSVEIVNEFKSSTSIVAGDVLGKKANEQLECCRIGADFRIRTSSEVR